MERLDLLAELEIEAKACRQCYLAEERTNVAFGDGDPLSPLMLVGEGPGEQEDIQGKPFVGPAGQLLDKILEAAGIGRSRVYICNIVKCRPRNLPGRPGFRPGGGLNRPPTEEETKSCLPWLEAQIAIIQPKIILCLGSVAAQTVIEPSFSVTRDRGKWFNRYGIKIMATYHPSALLRDPAKKKPAWEDFQRIRDAFYQILGRQ
ncbi:MAG: uracil-DNA glycosylase [Bacillota bacterium]